MKLGGIALYLYTSDLATGSDSVDPAKLDPANCGKGKKVALVLGLRQGVFVVI